MQPQQDDCFSLGHQFDYLQKSSRPWLTSDLILLIAAKREAVGTPAYDDAIKACSVGIMKEYHNYSSRARQ